MVRNINNDTPHIIIGQGEYAEEINLNYPTPPEPSPEAKLFADIIDRAEGEGYSEGFDDGYREGHMDGWDKGRGTLQAHYTLGFMAIVLASIGFGCLLGFAVVTNIEQQQVAEVGHE